MKTPVTVHDIEKLRSVKLTKRLLLGVVNSQYDPLGLACPLPIKMEIMMREI